MKAYYGVIDKLELVECGWNCLVGMPKEITLTKYHKTQGGVLKELKNRFGRVIKYNDLSRVFNANIPSYINGEKNIIRIKWIEII